jgi:hypothetical protein
MFKYVLISDRIEMLTPKFELTQTETKVCITIFAPYTNISETEIYIENNDFRFFSPPYYLRYVEHALEIIHVYWNCIFDIGNVVSSYP